MRYLSLARWSVAVLTAFLVVQSFAASPSRDLTVTPKAVPGSVSITGEYWALIIGIDKYQHAPKLESAVKDATAVRDVLLSRYGFTRERIIELLDRQATRVNIEHALYKLSRQVGPEDSVLIYYAGHGQYEEDGKLAWWVPVDAEPKQPGTFIMDVSILNYVKGMKAKHVYLVVDSCFSGTLFGTRAMPPIDDQWFARLYAKSSRWGLTSGATEPVADYGKGGHSVFAYHFLTLLNENQEPYLVPSRIYDRLAPLVSNNANQTPRSEPLKNAGDEGGQFVFRLAATSAQPEKKGLSTALSQTEQELKALQVQEQRLAEEQSSVDEERRLKALQGEIAIKKQQLTEKKKVIEEARARPYDAPQQAGKEITGKDGAPMVLVPAGEFVMGSQKSEGGPDQHPRHRVFLDAFYLDKYEVTHFSYKRFLRDTGHKVPSHWKTIDFESEESKWPIVSVSWFDAKAYCEWAGKRLPTEAEWEKAARGTDGRKYPWGNELPWEPRALPNEYKANIGAVGKKGIGLKPVGSFPKDVSPYGLYDMAGNVGEWINDWYDAEYYGVSDERNPQGPRSPTGYKVFRGHYWDGVISDAALAFRHFWQPDKSDMATGFRCAMEAPK